MFTKPFRRKPTKKVEPIPQVKKFTPVVDNTFEPPKPRRGIFGFKKVEQPSDDKS